MEKITPFLWFDGKAEEAANFYVSLFSNSKWVNCLDGVDPQELIDAPVKYFDMLHDAVSPPPVETRHL